MTTHRRPRRAAATAGAALLLAAVSAYTPAAGQQTTGEITIEDVGDQGLVARFYGPPDRSPRTTVLLLAGSGGGFPEHAPPRDLALSGYRVLSLAYARNWQGQPPELTRPRILDVPLEYLFTALDWLKTRPDVRPDAIALMGESRGAELALLVASHRPDVAGVVAFSPSGLRWGAVRGGGAAWTLNGIALPWAQGTYHRSEPLREFTDVLDGPPPSVAAATIEVERIRGPILLVSSTADQVWPSARMATDIERRLKERQFAFRVEHLQFADASHLLMGFGPGITASGTGPSAMRFGGTPAGTETARNAGWARAKQFLAGL